jgi:hypothetical protein
MSPASGITKPQLIQRIIKTICQCFEGPNVDDNVQLQIIKVNFENAEFNRFILNDTFS